MQPEARVLLTHVQGAAEAIEEFTAGRTREDLGTSRLLRAAVYCEFVIIGEALAQLRQLDEALVDRIFEWHRIIGFRNQIIHGYAQIDHEITWRIVEDKLAVLRREVQALLNS